MTQISPMLAPALLLDRRSECHLSQPRPGRPVQPVTRR